MTLAFRFALNEVFHTVHGFEDCAAKQSPPDSLVLCATVVEGAGMTRQIARIPDRGSISFVPKHPVESAG